MSGSPKRVAIVGGGCAGLTAAYELTRPELRGQYEVTVYQSGWRLGGKGASGRGRHDRIEEHGIHVWMGCYENAFRLIREVYAHAAALRPGCRISSWRDAFTPMPHVGLAHWTPEIGWDVWSTYFPPMPGMPGDPLDGPGPAGHDPFSVQGYLVRSVMVLGMLVETAYASPTRGPSVPQSESEQLRGTDLASLVQRAQRVIVGGLQALRSPVQQLEATRLLVSLFAIFTPTLRAVALELLDVVIAALVQGLGPASRSGLDARLVATIVDIVGACVRGCVADGILGSPRGFDAADDWDFRDWLRRHGAAPQSIDSPFVRGLYSLMFAYEDGDHRRPRLSTGVALRVCARVFFTYRGSMFWRMQAGMGEIVFAPIYQVLRDRGVRFELFHRLEAIHVEDGIGLAGKPTSRVQSLDFLVQARTRSGAPYSPLVDVDGLPCWPSEPLWDQLDAPIAPPGEPADLEAAWDRRGVGRRTLHVARDFDFVVLAVGLGEVPAVASELLSRHPSWRTMVERVKTVATQALQLWLEPTMPALGWTRGPIIMTAFHNPFDSWADMSALLPEESWPVGHQPHALAYFCNVLPDPPPGASEPSAAQAAAMASRVRDHAVGFLEHEIGALWPAAIGADGHFRWDWLVSPQGGEGQARLDAQYLRANCNPSDRYVLSLPGSTRYRISPLDRDCDNLTVAGDWTACGIDVGCIEAAVMSGMLAAHALTGNRPRCEEIIGYHHP